ncbi:MAG: NAD(+)/NADH kinase [Treponema sp.]|jgi:NAD+ kinase|nr:NAD(+)/NADH kinase [Treponema sp.]
MAKAVLFINNKKENAEYLASEIRRCLESRGFEHDSFSLDNEIVFETQSAYDIAFSIGGDGTVLYAVRCMAPLGIPVFPVNLGAFGFIAGIHPENWKSVFDDWCSGKAEFSRRLMLETRVERRGRVVARNICLNEALVSSPGIAKLIRLNVSLNAGTLSEYAVSTGTLGENVVRDFLHLAQYRSDGLIAATPTGSTAHSAASGGPILDPEIEAFILNPVCPFTLSHRPLVLPAAQTVLIEVEEDQKGGLMLTADGQLTQILEGGDRVFISPAAYKGILIASGRAAFYDALKHKFFWMASAMAGGFKAAAAEPEGSADKSGSYAGGRDHA